MYDEQAKEVAHSRLQGGKDLTPRENALSILDDRIREFADEITVLEQRLVSVLKMSETKPAGTVREVGESPLMDRAYKVLEMRIYLSSILERLDV